MRWTRWVSAVSLIWWVGAIAYGIPSSSKFQQRTAAFGLGAIGGGAVPASRVLTPVGTSISNHPLFESLYVGEPDRVVAKNRYGKVTARDLYLYLVMTRSSIPAYILEKYDKEKFPDQREKLAADVRKAIDEYIFVNQVLPRLVGNSEWNAVDELRARVAAHEAYRFVYIAEIVRSKIRLTDADRVKYLQEHRTEIAAPERWRVRYIFMRSEDADPLEQQDAVQKRMEDLRLDILRGKIDFAEAARQFSEAPSARNGGEIPPFRRGEMFFYFEEAAARLQPGEVSEVMRGPHGFYMLQLLETLPPEELSLDNPVQAGKVEDGLTRQVLRAQYLWDMKVLLEERRRPVLDMRPWDEKRPDQVVGAVGGFKITKGQLLNAFPSLASEDLVDQEANVETTLRRVLEGEAIAQAVHEAGKQESVFLGPMLEMARNLALLEKYKEKLACQLKPSREVVKRFWRSHPELFTPLAMRRVVEVTLTPLNTAAAPEQTVVELERALAQGGGVAPSPLVPQEPEAVIPDVPELTTSSETEAPLHDSEETSQPAVQTQVEQTVTTAALTNDKPTTGSGGAGPAEPAKGGNQQPVKVGGKSLPTTTDASQSSTWVGPSGFVSATAQETMPRAAKTAKPPVRARTISPTQLREVVQNYRSSDWQLAYRDLGFIYVEDHPEIPATVDKLGKGDYLPPKFENGRAITYVVEDVRRPSKPSFEEIESYAYRVWREVELERRLNAIRARELGKANTNYSF